MKAIHLQTEYLNNPIGIDISNPLLTWCCEGGMKQSAYQICTKNWDSGKVYTDSMNAIYPLKLYDKERVEWKIRLWDENNQVGDWNYACFEMGISYWNAKWITGNYRVNKRKRYPVDCFRKLFEIENVNKARLYISACGVYEAKLNGDKVGNFHLAPGITDYNKRIQYQTYDITNMLKNGENELSIQLGDGWYRGSTGAWGLLNQYGIETKFIAQLEIQLNDGSYKTILSDDSWDWSNDGPIVFADNKDGEIVDANKVPTYHSKAKLTSIDVVPTSSNNVYLTEHEELSATKIISPSNKTILDFKQNIAGIIRFRVEAKGNEKIVLKFGELIDQDGEFTQKNIQLVSKKKTTPLQQVIYTCKEGMNEYKTTFAIFGFQYVLVESELDLQDIKAIAIYSDMEQTSEFNCSNELLNQFYRSTLWSAKNNHADLPTDCPTRERHGWSGDAQIFCGSASYLFNYRSFARKYLHDLVDEQHKNGNIGQIAPYGGVDFYMNRMNGSAGWSDAIVLIPWKIYSQYNDLRILEEFYPAMKRYAKYKQSTVGSWYMTSKPTGIPLKYARYISNYGQSYGEWAEPADVNAFKVKDFINPHPEETTAYIVYLMEHMVKIAKLLGKWEDVKEFDACARKVRIGYQKLVETKEYSMDVDRQAKQVRPLYMNLLNPIQTEFAKKRLIQSLDSYNWRLGTGFLSTPFILYVLETIDIEYAYKLLENEEIPGWLSMPKNGANTIWEAWEGPNSTQGGIGSLNHYSKGALMEWVFSRMCGIQVNHHNNFTIAPSIGGSFTYASLCYKSIYGKITSSWKKEKNTVVFDICIPSNCFADFIYKDEHKVLQAGTYHFVFEEK